MSTVHYSYTTKLASTCQQYALPLLHTACSTSQQFGLTLHHIGCQYKSTVHVIVKLRSFPVHANSTCYCYTINLDGTCQQYTLPLHHTVCQYMPKLQFTVTPNSLTVHVNNTLYRYTIHLASTCQQYRIPLHHCCGLPGQTPRYSLRRHDTPWQVL